MNPTSSTPPQPPPLASPTPVETEPYSGPLDVRSLFEVLLRQPAALVARLQQDHRGTSGRLVLLAAVSTAAYGLVLGTFAGHEQLWAAPLKVTCGLLLAAVICFPSLYIFSCLAGSRIGAGPLAVCFGAALSLGGILLLGFAPAVWIFTQSTDSFGFMGFLALAAWIVAVGFAIGFLRRALRATGGFRPGPLAVWSGIFLLVTFQMSTSLRPILGRSNSFLTTEKKFFLVHWGDCIDRSLDPPKPATEKPKAETTATQGNRGTPAPASDGQNPYATH